jgi:hypothetical protein
MFEIIGKKLFCRCFNLQCPFRGATLVHAALVGQKPEQSNHRWVLRVTNQGSPLSILSNQSLIDQPLQVVGQCRGRKPDLLLNTADREAAVARTHQSPKDSEPSGVTQRLELASCYFDNHGNNNRN